MTPAAAPQPTPEQAQRTFLVLTGGEVTHIERLRRGWGHLSWQVTTPQGCYLLKTGIRRPTVAEMFHEVTAQQLAATADLPAPVVVATSTGDNPLGRPCYVQTWVDGRDAESAWPDLEPAERSRLATRFGQAVARLHGITGPRFAEDPSGSRTHPSWTDACRYRLAKVITANQTAGLLPSLTLHQIDDFLDQRIAALPSGIVPTLTHRDLYLANVIDRGPHPAALIDFEAVAFYDPVWDFVKLGMWVFDRHPDLRPAFLTGYTHARPLPPDFDRRLLVYRGIEYLAAFPYFGHTWPDETMLDSFRRLLTGWLEETGLPTKIAP